MYLAVMILNLNTLNNSNFLFGKFGFFKFSKNHNLCICFAAKFKLPKFSKFKILTYFILYF